MVHLKCAPRFSGVCPCVEGCEELWPGPEMLMGDFSEKCVCSRPVLWGWCAVLWGLGRCPLWDTKSQGFPPLDELFRNVLCFCQAGKLCYTEDRIVLDEEGLQQRKKVMFSACGWLFVEFLVLQKLLLAGRKQSFSLGPLGCDEWAVGKATAETAGSKVNEEPCWDIALAVYGK